MPRKTATNKPVPASTESESTLVVSEPQAKKPATKRSSKKEVLLLPPPVVEDVVEEEVSDVESTGTTTPGGSKSRRVPTKELVVESFDDLVELVETEINRLRENQNKAKGVKFLRSLNKRIKSLRSQTSRVMKQRQRTNRKNNNNSGFLKPVRISNDMAKFTGWDATELRSRVDVTKYICNYIRENELQNPTDRRQILADSKLSKLLSYDSKKETEPLTYYRIQSYMKKHFLKE